MILFAFINNYNKRFFILIQKYKNNNIIIIKTTKNQLYGHFVNYNKYLSK